MTIPCPQCLAEVTPQPQDSGSPLWPVLCHECGARFVVDSSQFEQPKSALNFQIPPPLPAPVATSPLLSELQEEDAPEDALFALDDLRSLTAEGPTQEEEQQERDTQEWDVESMAEPSSGHHAIPLITPTPAAALAKSLDEAASLYPAASTLPPTRRRSGLVPALGVAALAAAGAVLLLGVGGKPQPDAGAVTPAAVPAVAVVTPSLSSPSEVVTAVPAAPSELSASASTAPAPKSAPAAALGATPSQKAAALPKQQREMTGTAEPEREIQAAEASNDVVPAEQSASVAVETAPSGHGPLQTEKATAALQEAVTKARNCAGGPTETVKVTALLLPSGRVAHVDVGAAAGTPAEACVMSAFQSTQVPPFDGQERDVSISFQPRTQP